MSELDELEAKLQAMREWCRRAPANEEGLLAYQSQLKAERELALAKGEETATALHWTPLWDEAAPEPHLLCSGSKTLLLYYIAEHDPNWDGSYVRMASPASQAVRGIALVEFERSTDVKFGGPNDEAGHLLVGRGYGGYGAYLVKNSQWIEEGKRLDSRHPKFDPSTYPEQNHYLLAFRDQTLDCLADSYRVEELRVSFPEALGLARQRLIEYDEEE